MICTDGNTGYGRDISPAEMLQHNGDAAFNFIQISAEFPRSDGPGYGIGHKHALGRSILLGKSPGDGP